MGPPMRLKQSAKSGLRAVLPTRDLRALGPGPEVTSSLRDVRSLHHQVARGAIANAIGVNLGSAAVRNTGRAGKFCFAVSGETRSAPRPTKPPVADLG